MKYDFTDLPKAIFEASMNYAKSHSQYEYLCEMKKVKLAEFMGNYGGATSQSLKEQLALAEPEYQKFLGTLRDAHYEELKDKAHLVARQSEFDLQRSLESTKRAELTLR